MRALAAVTRTRLSAFVSRTPQYPSCSIEGRTASCSNTAGTCGPSPARAVWRRWPRAGPGRTYLGCGSTSHWDTRDPSPRTEICSAEEGGKRRMPDHSPSCFSAVCRRLHLEQFGIEARVRHELVVASLFQDAAVAQDDDQVGHPDRGEAV